MPIDDGIEEGVAAAALTGSEISKSKKKSDAPELSSDARLNEDDVENCRNCGAPLAGTYCLECGQKDDDWRRPFQTFIADIAENTLSLDGRVLKTLAMLISVPGGLTRDYMAGKRARYTAPLRMYVASTVMFFLLVWALDIAILDVRFELKDNFERSDVEATEVEPPAPPVEDSPTSGAEGNGDDTPDDVDTAQEPPTPPEVEAESGGDGVNLVDHAFASLLGNIGSIAPDLQNDDRPLDEIMEDVETAFEDNTDLSDSQKRAILEKVRADIEKARADMQEFREKDRTEYGERYSRTYSFDDSDFETPEGFPYNVTVDAFVFMDNEPRTGLRPEDIERIVNDGDTPQYVLQVTEGFSRALEDPHRVNALFNDWLPRLLFVLVPVFALLLRMTHWGQQRYYMHQLVFSLHFHSFLFLLMSLLAVVMPYVGGANAMPAFWLTTSVYLFVALKIGQQQGWVRSFIKAGFLYWFYALIFMSALTYGVLEGLREL